MLVDCVTATLVWRTQDTVLVINTALIKIKSQSLNQNASKQTLKWERLEQMEERGKEKKKPYDSVLLACYRQPAFCHFFNQLADCIIGHDMWEEFKKQCLDSDIEIFSLCLVIH